MLLTILATAEKVILLSATAAVCTGTYHITVTQRSTEKIQGVVTNNQGIQYRVTVWAGRSACSCLHSRHRSLICKHAVALALHVIRHPADSPQKGAHKPAPRLARVRTAD